MKRLFIFITIAAIITSCTKTKSSSSGCYDCKISDYDSCHYFSKSGVDSYAAVMVRYPVRDSLICNDSIRTHVDPVWGSTPYPLHVRKYDCKGM